MEIKIIKDETNNSLKRRNLSVIVRNKITPSRFEVKNKLAAMLDSKPDRIIIENLESVYGKQETLGTIQIYENEERLKQITFEYLTARDTVPAKEEEAAEGEPEAVATPESGTEEKGGADASETREKAKNEPIAEAEPAEEAKVEKEGEVSGDASEPEEKNKSE